MSLSYANDEAARLRRRADDVAETLTRLRLRLATAGARETRRQLRQRIAVMQRVWLSLRHEAAVLYPAPRLERGAAGVRAARQARHCALCPSPTSRGAVLCAACVTVARYCWRCGCVKPHAAFSGAPRAERGQCRACVLVYPPRPRVDPERKAASTAARVQTMMDAARAAHRARGDASLAQLRAAMDEVGPPCGGDYWGRVAALVGRSPDACRALWRRAKQREEAIPSATTTT